MSVGVTCGDLVKIAGGVEGGMYLGGNCALLPHSDHVAVQVGGCLSCRSHQPGGNTS